MFLRIFCLLLSLIPNLLCQKTPLSTTGPPAGVDEKKLGRPPGAQTLDAGAIAACRAKLTSSSPELTARYSESVLNDICMHNVEWQRTVESASARRAQRTNFTEAQSTWLHSLHRCNDPSCICAAKVNSCSDATQDAFQPRRNKRQNFIVDNFLPNRIGRAVRREIRQLSNNDRWRYFRALNALKFARIDGMSKYDILVLYHTPEFSPEAHFSAGLLPYHRELLKNLEIALRMVDPGVALHYWDSTMDALLPNPADSVLWTSEFFGNGFGDVRSGPFSNWIAFRDPETGQFSASGRLTRNLGAQGRLLTDRDVNIIMSKGAFRNLVFCIDPFVETAHGANHMWVGGHMLPLRVSPNDPVFYSLHSFIDSIWERWRWTHQSYQQRANEFVWDNEACNVMSTGDSRLSPFSMSILDGLSNDYTDVFYSYANRPGCPNCGSDYLFCDTRRNKCLSKIRQGGLCAGLEGFDACVDSQCIDGRCSGDAVAQPTLITTAVNSPNSENANGNGNQVAAAQTSACGNTHPCCKHWASQGECQKNQEWMGSSCMSACHVCTANDDCSDTHSNCAMWSSQGECQSNANWMRVSCQRSCNTCSSNVDTEQCGGASADATQSSSNSRPPCQNADARCSTWARNGQCDSNAAWMRPNCALACNAC